MKKNAKKKHRSENHDPAVIERVFILHNEGYTLVSIGRHMNLSIDTLRSWIYWKCRIKLCNRIKDKIKGNVA